MNFTLTPAATKFIRMMIRADGDAAQRFPACGQPWRLLGLRG